MDCRTRWIGPLLWCGIVLTALVVWNWPLTSRATTTFAADKPRPAAKAEAVSRPPAKSPSRKIRQVSAEQPAPIEPYPVPPELQGIDLRRQSPEEALAKSQGCLECHKTVEDP